VISQIIDKVACLTTNESNCSNSATLLQSIVLHRICRFAER